jgi:hypothetical protein
MRKIFMGNVSFLLIFFFVSQFCKAQIIENLPGSFGCYILKSGELVMLPEITATKKNPLSGPGSSWGIFGLDSKPEVAVEEQRPTIFIYEPGLNLKQLRLGRLWYFEKLRAVDFHGEPPGPESFKKSCGVERKSLLDFGKWTVVGTYSIAGRTVPNRPELFRIRPKRKLPPGVYAVYDRTKFSSRSVQSASGIPLRAFEVVGVEKKLPEYTPVSHPRFTLLKCFLSDKRERIEDLNAAKDNFFVSDNPIFTYAQIKGHRSGEVIEFIWYRPDGTVQIRQKQALRLPPRGKIFHVYQEFRPLNLLMPGKWMLEVKIYGELVKRFLFQVSTK